jgi:CDGSH-type Zn-finger protein/uncharacterized Fe-S cluster protein YjdI
MTDKRYYGNDVDILYDAKRCIHAEECVRKLSNVFDNRKRPWINPNGASGDAVIKLVMQCPSGALHAERKDDSEGEPIPQRNRITLWDDGPVQVYGDLYLTAAGVEKEQETRLTLCRCGVSANKPFCDNAHKKIDFKAAAPVPVEGNGSSEGGRLHITAHANGPVEIRGHFEMYNQAGELLCIGTETWLCRCGGSAKKPFCDSTHKRNGFMAE